MGWSPNWGLIGRTRSEAGAYVARRALENNVCGEADSHHGFTGVEAVERFVVVRDDL